MFSEYLEKITHSRVYDVARETPLEKATLLSERLGNQIYLKREDLQPVFSFKLRGAYNKIASLSREERERGVIAASAGNHAQGVALAAARQQVRALIVMPKTTPQIKVDGVRRRGGQIILHGSTYDEAYEHAAELAKIEGMTFIHPYDDPMVIAGQGTIAMEILCQHQGDSLHAIFVPVGGGGLIAGVAAYIKSKRPDIKVIGVEPDDAASMYEALKADQRIILDSVGIFADGVAVRQVGEEPFRIARETVDEVILVSGDEVCAAIKDIFDDTRSIAEPAGALSVAGMKKYVARDAIRDEFLVAIDSGANVNFDRLRYVAERAELGEQKEVLLAAVIPEEPGSFRDFCHTLGPRSITEFNYRYGSEKDAYVFAGVELRGDDDRKKLFQHLADKGYLVLDLSDDEIAKLHIRHMVGGHSPSLSNERLFRFEFPERPGALYRFLTSMSQHWNISLFHYRNHGADYGRVLVGIQVDDAESAEFQQFLDELGYPCWEETANPAYKMFLR